MMDISIIICTRNRHKDIAICLNSIINQTVKPAEVIIVDSSINEETQEVYEKYKTSLKLKYIKSSAGTAYQRNVGLNYANGDIILYIDDDVELEKSYLNFLHKGYTEHPEIFGTNGILMNFTPSFVDNIFCKIFFLPCKKNGGIQPSYFPRLPANEKFMYLDTLHGCNMSYKKEIFLEQRFDENLKGYSNMEDPDFSYRASRNHRLAQLPDCRLVHHTSRNWRENLQYLNEKLTVQHYYIFRKNFKLTLPRIMAFTWSHIGLMIRDTCRLIVRLKADALIGSFKGNLVILQNLKKNQITEKIKQYN